MLERNWAWVASFALVLAACGGGGDDDDDAASTTSGLAGIYETVSDDYYQPCDGPPANTGNDPPYFRIVDDAFLGSPFVDVYRCTSGDPSSCEDENTGAPFIFAASKTSSGAFHSESESRSGTDTDCTASYDTDDIEKTADGVKLTSVEHSAEWSGADCSVEFTEAVANKTKSLPCFKREVRSGKLTQAQ